GPRHARAAHREGPQDRGREPMTCCGHALTRRAWIWNALFASAGATLGACASSRSDAPAASAMPSDAASQLLRDAPAASATPSDAASRLLRDNVSVDVHTHAGATGITSKNPPSGDLARGMRAGRIAVVCLADVPHA